LDASFLRVETPTAHMHVGWLSLLELPPGLARLDSTALTERIAARLHLAPRFRQRLAAAPLALAAARWEDDPGFDIARHVSVADSALEQFRAARSVAELGLSPGRGLRIAATVRRAAMSVAEDALRPAPASYLNAPIGPGRTLVRHRVRLPSLLRIKSHAGVTL